MSPYNRSAVEIGVCVCVCQSIFNYVTDKCHENFRANICNGSLHLDNLESGKSL
jgi:hypothetical protein